MKAFKIVNGDIVFNSLNDIEMVSGKDEEVQSIDRILTTNTGEWFLNILFGLDYSKVRGKGRTRAEIELALLDALSQDERTLDVEFERIDINERNRTLTVKFSDGREVII